MNQKITELWESHQKLEKELTDELNKLACVGDDCNCDGKEYWDVVHEGNLIMETIRICLSCGGFVEVRQ